MIQEIHNEDCLNVLKNIDSESVQLICIDPPYFLLKNQQWDNQWKNQKEYLDWCEIWAKECKRILKNDGAFYSFQDWRMIAEYVILLKSIFPYFQNWIAWERIKGRASSKNWKSSKEEIVYFSKSQNPKFFAQEKLRPVIAPYKDEEGKPKGWFVDEEGNRVRWTGVGNVWHYTPPVWSSKTEPPRHPTQKPLMMMERIIESATEEMDIVLDCFDGSGSTLVAAKNLKRQFIGVEKEEKFYNTCLERLK